MLVDEIVTKPVETVEQTAPNLDQMNQDPASQAAMQLPGMIAYFRNLIETKLGGVHAKKVLMTIAETPFQTEEVHFTTRDQYEAYYLGLNIESAKFKIFLAGLREEAKKAQEQQNSVNTEEKKEETNGN